MPSHIRFCFVLPLLLIAVAACPAQSQESQAPSVVDAARRAREKKKSEKPVRVVTDDNIPRDATSPSAPSAAPAAEPSGPRHPAVDEFGNPVGPTETEEALPPAAPQAASGGESAPAPAPAAAPQQSASGDADRANEQLAQAQKELDFAKRELALEQDTLYSKTEYSHDAAGKAKIDALQRAVNDKQQAVDDLKAQLAALPAVPERPAPPRS